MPALAVRADQVRTLYQQSVPVLLTNLVNAVIVAAAAWSVVPHPRLTAWAAGMAVMTVARFELRRRYRRADPPPAEAERWGRRFVLGSGIGGVLWGIAGALFFEPNTPLLQILITFVIGGMGAGAAGTLSCYLPAFAAYLVPSVLPLFVRVALIGGPLYLAMAAMILVYVAGLVLVARNTNRVVTQAFRLRFENEVLLGKLAAAQLTLEDANRTLEQKVAERSAALEQQGEQLRQAQRLEAVGRLAGGVAHDFNNLLTVVMANASLLLESRDLSPDARAALEQTRGASERGADLVRQLLAFGRRQRLAPDELDLNLVVNELRPLLSRLMTERITLELELLPEPLYVLVDRSQIEQVLVNLATNARDAMPDGGRLTIATASAHLAQAAPGRPAGDHVVLTVSDTGQGMDAETQRRAFEPFFTTKALGRGTGLGLATVHGIVEQSGGCIELASSPGRGSRFQVFLPRKRLPAEQAPQRRAPTPPRAQAPLTVLLAEDEDVVRDATTRLLERMGHTVLPAPSGEAALALAESHGARIDVLVADVVMGKLGGALLARRLRERRPEIGVLLVSGYSWDRDLAAADGAARFAFLHKPFTTEALAEALATALEAPRSPREPTAPAPGVQPH